VLILSDSGCIEKLVMGSFDCLFRNDEYSGPRWYGEWDGKTHNIAMRRASDMRFEGIRDDLAFSIEYKLESDRLLIAAAIKNGGASTFRPVKAGLKLGLDTYMDTWPEWNDKLFPTLLRCEKTHFWGYAMSTEGRILGIASPDPVASWSLDYNKTGDLPDSDWGHRIYTINLDLMNALPLPARHPQNLYELQPGERRSWSIYLVPVNDLADLKPMLSKICSAPMLEAGRYTLAPGESTGIHVFFDESVQLEITGPDDMTRPFNSKFTAPEEAGVYTITAASESGKVSEAKIYVRRPWSWYLKQARKAAVDMPQKASCCCESWYGHFSSFLARKYFPESDLDAKAEENFRKILPLMFDVEHGIPTLLPDRIQNTCSMISLLTDYYEATRSLADLESAAKLADWIITRQDADGSYRGQNDGHYTCVIYAAKSMIELALVEKELADSIWQQRYERHMTSARAAIDNLERLGDNIGTEGEHTFEDGMISCSALQLGLFALLQSDPTERERYTQAAKNLLERHRCLEQIIVPDCRMAGCTLRFWEAQYDVLIKQNMITSPHGWTSWKTYTTWYLYLLTGEESLLQRTMDTLGACMQMIDADTGKLRWAFVADPYIRAEVFEQDPAQSGKPTIQDRVIGEDYVDMISGWWKAPCNALTGGYWGQGGCCDNDVHEHFKCLEEVALTSAYIIEQQRGTFSTWNCGIEMEEDRVHIYPAEDIVESVHINLRKPHSIIVHFAGREIAAEVDGMQWIRR
jgi:hypothetical protein